MTKDFTDLVTDPLKEYLPMKKFNLNTNYKHDLTQEMKALIKERDMLGKDPKRQNYNTPCKNNQLMD